MGTADTTERRVLEAARTVGGVAVAVFGQLAVDMPGGHFGPGGEITPFGAWFSVAVATVGGIAAVAQVAGRRWGQGLAATLVAAAAAFVPALGADPAVAGAVIGWNLAVFVALVVPGGSAWRLARGAQRDEEVDRLATIGRGARHLAGVTLALAVIVVGFDLGAEASALVLCLVLALSVAAATMPALVQAARSGAKSPWLAAACLVGAAAASSDPEETLTWLAGYLLVIVVVVSARTELAADLLAFFLGAPTVLVVASFVLLIALGTLFLSFPVARTGVVAMQPVDALFTATSAACVTGLAVVDTGTAYSSFGHGVILALIQAGGLNIMVLSILAAMVLGQTTFGRKGERALGEVLDLQSKRAAPRLIAVIVGGTLVIEVVGAVVLSWAFARRGVSVGEAVWQGTFHAVSAFCNAGFSLFSDSLCGFAGDPVVLLTTATLITLGGLGFTVLALPLLRFGGRGEVSLGIQARLVLISSAALVVGGTVWIAGAEWQGALAGMGAADKLLNALFQSVTTRTAGFNSVDIAALQGSTVLVVLALMFVGASPGSTGGGVKTTTMAVLLSSIPAIAQGRPRLVVFHRTIALETVYRCAAITAVSTLTVFGGGLALLATQPLTFQSALFEAVSAFATVGLSQGATAQLDTLGKLVVVGLMLAGRVGPIGLAVLLGTSRQSRVSHPEVRIMVG